MSSRMRIFICHPYAAGIHTIEENMLNAVAVRNRLWSEGNNPILPTYSHWCVDEITGSDSFYDINRDEINTSDSVHFVMNSDGLSEGQRRLYEYVQCISKPYTIEEV